MFLMSYFRQIFLNLIEEKDSKQIIFLLGTRQIGKNTLLKNVTKKFIKELNKLSHHKLI